MCLSRNYFWCGWLLVPSPTEHVAGPVPFFLEFLCRDRVTTNMCNSFTLSIHVGQSFEFKTFHSFEFSKNKCDGNDFCSQSFLRSACYNTVHQASKESTKIHLAEDAAWSILRLSAFLSNHMFDWWVWDPAVGTSCNSCCQQDHQWRGWYCGYWSLVASWPLTKLKCCQLCC